MEREFSSNEKVKIDRLEIEKVLVRDKRNGKDVIWAERVIALYNTKGIGTQSDPVRQTIKYWDMHGNYIGELNKGDINPLVL